jgi:ADP-ribosylglycohydrolase
VPNHVNPICKVKARTMSRDLLSTLIDRFQGSALGTFVGDAMGRELEGWPWELIMAKHGILKGIGEGFYADDTIGAMAGAIAGAYYGYSSIPPACIEPLENGEKERDYVAVLAEELAQIKAREQGWWI